MQKKYYGLEMRKNLGLTTCLSFFWIYFVYHDRLGTKIKINLRIKHNHSRSE